MMAQEEFVEAEDYDEEDDDDFEFEDQEDGDVEEVEDEDDEDVEAIPSASFIRGLEPLPGMRQQGAPNGGARRAPQPEHAKEWTGLRQLPAATQTVFLELLGKLRDQKKTKLTILMLGKTGVGKSSTANSIFAEHVAPVAAMQSDTSKATAFSRVAAGFTLTIIDTPGLLEADAVSTSTLAGIAYEVRGRPVDAVLYLHRLDDTRVDAADVQVIEGISRMLGDNIWANAFVGLTHGRLTSLPDNMAFDDYVERRAGAVRTAIAKHGGPGGKRAELPTVLIENSSRAPTNAAGEKLLGNKRPWLPDLMRQVTEKASSWAPYRYDPDVIKRADPNKRRRWLIPLVLLAQIAFKVLVLDRLLEEDGITGDAYGPYDADFVAEERERVAREKERVRKRKEAEKARKRAGQQRPSAQAGSGAAGTAASSSYDDYEDDEDDYEDED